MMAIPGVPVGCPETTQARARSDRRLVPRPARWGSWGPRRRSFLPTLKPSTLRLRVHAAPTPRSNNVAEGGIPFGCHVTLQLERVAFPDNTDKAIPEQSLHTNFRPHLAQDTDLKVGQPSRKCAAVFSILGAKRKRTSGAIAVAAAIRAAPKTSTKPSLARMVKVRCKIGKSGSVVEGRSTARASSTAFRVRWRSTAAWGVNTIRRPARTNSGSPVASRSRDNVRLIAEALNPSRRAAPTTLPSASNASSAMSRFKSGSGMPDRNIGRQRMAFVAGYKCKRCVFRPVCSTDIFPVLICHRAPRAEVALAQVSLTGNDSCKTHLRKRPSSLSVHPAASASQWPRNTSSAAGE